MRYNNFSSFLKNKYGEKVWKIPLHAGFSCPNLDGTLSDTGCIYCNNKAFNIQAGKNSQSVDEQIRSSIQRLKKTRKVSKFIAYFQTYTNTYAPVDTLKKTYDIVLNYPEIVALSIGTRPDCVDQEKLDLIERYTDTMDVWLEYGLQSMHDNTLKRINRGHTYEDFLKAVRLTKERNIAICVHVIAGLPGETRDDFLQTVQAVAGLKIDGIKFHPLHVLKDTVLEQMYYRNQITLLKAEDYADIICDALEILPEKVVIQRLTADADEQFLVAPEWCSKQGKMKVIDLINRKLEVRQTCQGYRYK
ncbi:MAG: TIGR01212 family radical SAM protein [bacterium]